MENLNILINVVILFFEFVILLKLNVITPNNLHKKSKK